MKKIIILILILTPFITNAQESPINSFFEKHSGQEGYTSIYITKYMFELFSKVTDDNEAKEFEDITSKLNAIKILTMDSTMNANSPIGFEKQITSLLPKSTYKDLLVIKDGNETIKFLINEKDNLISEFVMIVYGDTEPVLIILDGEINLKQISKLSATMNVKGFEHLDKVN